MSRKRKANSDDTPPEIENMSIPDHYAFFLHNGRLPEVVSHSCSTFGCCNPKHLIEKTSKEVAKTKMLSEELFWKSIDTSGGPNACWPRKNKPHHSGYCYVRFNGVRIGAHRVAFFLANKYMPEMVLHRCDFRSCSNPSHLFAGNQAINMADMKQKRRSTYGERAAGAKITEKDVMEIRKLIEDPRVTQLQLANKYGLSDTTISSIVSGQTWGHLPFNSSRRLSAACVLDASRVREMRAMFASGLSCSEISKTSGVARTTVYYVVNRKTWRHLP